MPRAVKYLLAALAVFVCLAVALWVYSSDQDQKNFRAAKNRCEIGCIQDSGGLEQCRALCKDHPDHYP